MGNYCRVATRNFGSEPFFIEIGDHVYLTSGVSFITHDGGVWVFREEDPTFTVFGKIKIGSNTYIGNNTSILPGVTIGNNCVIGACSVVTKSIPDNVVAAGSPCGYICSTDEYHERMNKLNANTLLMNREQRLKCLTSLRDDKLIHKKMIDIVSHK